MKRKNVWWVSNPKRILPIKEMALAWSNDIQRQVSQMCYSNMDFNVAISSGVKALSAGPYIRIQILIITVPADVLAPNGARPSAKTVMTTMIDMIFVPSFFGFQGFRLCLRWSDDIAQNGRQDPAKSRGTSSVNTVRPKLDGRRFPDDVFQYIFLNENVSKFHWYLFPSVQLTIFQHWFR